MEDPDKMLTNVIELVCPQLKLISSADSAIKHQNKWSKREVLGHLIDSANNNHQRFVSAQIKEDLVFETYNQEYWVHCQGYQKEEWENIINLWFFYNLHMAQLINQISDDKLTRPVLQHNLDKIAWKTIPKSETTTLLYFIYDYIAHLEHHILQILPDYQPQMRDNY